jgi:TPR repeat protein
LSHDVFVSYSQIDKLAADAACNTLESAGIRCWIAPRDVTLGSDWPSDIINAIDSAAVMVLIFSSNANSSPHVRRELERAIGAGVTIIPVRIESVDPSGSVSYLLSGIHWLDAVTPPLQEHLQRLAKSIKAILQSGGPKATGSASLPYLDGIISGGSPAGQGSTAGVQRPWRRFFARLVDYSIPLGILYGLESLAPPESIIWSLVPFTPAGVLLLFVPLEALLLHKFGTTPGKMLYRIDLRSTNGVEPIPIVSAALRAGYAMLPLEFVFISFALNTRGRPVWLLGLAVGVPWLLLLRSTLIRSGTTSWDRNRPWQIETRRRPHWVMVGVSWSMLFFVVCGFGAQLAPVNLYTQAATAYKRQDYPTALRWLRKAAAQDFAPAQSAIGWMYANGFGVPQNYEEGKRWALIAADERDPSAQAMRGVFYQKGLGVPQDYEQALKWFQMSAAQGNADGQFGMGGLYLTGSCVPQDYTEAMNWFRKAADQGQADAQAAIGELYLQGQGVSQNYPQALTWFQKAADQDNDDAEFGIGTLYADGHGIAQDRQTAAAWFHKAANHGNARAMLKLAVGYETGVGAPTDLDQARVWYEKAAAHGVATAKQWLDAHLASHTPPPSSQALGTPH